jgi:hypothetical protein
MSLRIDTLSQDARVQSSSNTPHSRFPSLNQPHALPCFPYYVPSLICAPHFLSSDHIPPLGSASIHSITFPSPVKVCSFRLHFASEHILLPNPSHRRSFLPLRPFLVSPSFSPFDHLSKSHPITLRFLSNIVISTHSVTYSSASWLFFT